MLKNKFKDVKIKKKEDCKNWMHRTLRLRRAMPREAMPR